MRTAVAFPLSVAITWPPYIGVGAQVEISKLMYTCLLMIFYAHMDVC